MRLPGAGAQSIVRVYQRNSSGSSLRSTPESADSIANGTRILPAHASGRPGVFVTLVTCQSQSPLRHVQLSRTLFTPRRDFANLTNDGVVLLRKCREEKLTFGHYINFCLVQFVLNV